MYLKVNVAQQRVRFFCIDFYEARASYFQKQTKQGKRFQIGSPKNQKKIYFFSSPLLPPTYIIHASLFKITSVTKWRNNATQTRFESIQFRVFFETGLCLAKISNKQHMVLFRKKCDQFFSANLKRNVPSVHAHFNFETFSNQKKIQFFSNTICICELFLYAHQLIGTVWISHTANKKDRFIIRQTQKTAKKV